MRAALIRFALVLVYAVGIAELVSLLYVMFLLGNGVGLTLVGTAVWMILVAPVYWAQSRLWDQLDRLEVWGR